MLGVEKIDGAGAILLARLFDRLSTTGRDVHVNEGSNHRAAKLIALYRRCHSDLPSEAVLSLSLFEKLGSAAAKVPGQAEKVLDFGGRCASALPTTIAKPSSVDWHSLPRLLQQIGADALPVTSVANLLVGAIVGLLGVSQLKPLGGISFVPGLVISAHFRELGPLITAVVIAGRSGAGLAAEIGTMRVSEETDALQSLGFDPVRWLVIPRCLALVATLPLLTLLGDMLAIVGGLGATTLTTNMTARTYLMQTIDHITLSNLFVGLVKTPFLALAIGLIGCGKGLATRGGAAAVGDSTTSAVVQSILFVVLISSVATFFASLIGI